MIAGVYPSQIPGPYIPPETRPDRGRANLILGRGELEEMEASPIQYTDTLLQPLRTPNSRTHLEMLNNTATNPGLNAQCTRWKIGLALVNEQRRCGFRNACWCFIILEKKRRTGSAKTRYCCILLRHGIVDMRGQWSMVDPYTTSMACVVRRDPPPPNLINILGRLRVVLDTINSSHPTSPEMRQSHLTAPQECKSATPSLLAEAATAVAAAACLCSGGGGAHRFGH